jgi:hypothetical protein
MDFIYPFKTTNKPLAIALSGMGRELSGRDDEGNVNNI